MLLGRVGGWGGSDSKSEPTEGVESESQVLSRREVIYRPSSSVLCNADELHEEKNDAGGGGTTGEQYTPFFF